MPPERKNITLEDAMHMNRHDRRALASKNNTSRIPGVQLPIVGKQKDAVVYLNQSDYNDLKESLKAIPTQTYIDKESKEKGECIVYNGVTYILKIDGESTQRETDIR